MSFNDICGQDIPLRILKSALARGRVPHAYLFHGMKGVGKRTAAMVFARALNCRESGGDSCDVCTSCLKAEHGNHPDIAVVEPDGLFIKVQAVRDMQDRMKFRPTEGRRRVIIVDDAERMNDTAANTLLKTLEEPTDSNMLILVTAHLNQILPTINSRCQKIQFSPLRPEAVTALLERKHVAHERAVMLASSSRGSIGKALELEADPHGEFRRSFAATCASLAEGALTPALFAAAGELAEDKEHLLDRLDVARSWLRDVLVFRETGEVERLVYRDLETTTREVSARVSSRRILGSIRAIQEAFTAVMGNANRQLAIEAMMFKLARSWPPSATERS